MSSDNTEAEGLLPCPGGCGAALREYKCSRDEGEYHIVECSHCLFSAPFDAWQRLAGQYVKIVDLCDLLGEIQAACRDGATQELEWASRIGDALSGFGWRARPDAIDQERQEIEALREILAHTDNAALREKLQAIERAAEDATEYVLAMLLREQKEENAALRAQVDELTLRSVGAMAIAEGDEGWEKVPIDCPMLEAVVKLRAQVEALRESLKSEADYCYGWAEHYAAENPERAARHRERGDRLSAVLQGEQDE